MKQIGFDAVLDINMMVLFNGTREETLNWLHAHSDKIDTLYVGMYDRPVIVSAWEYLNMYT